MTDILVSKGFIITNKYILNKLGIDAAILIGELCGEYAYWFREKKLKNDYFYSTRDNIFKNTGLTKYKQRKASKKLMEEDILIEEPRGYMPTLLWYKINGDKLYEILRLSEDYEKQYEDQDAYDY